MPTTFTSVFPNCNQHVCKPKHSVITISFCKVPGHYENSGERMGINPALSPPCQHQHSVSIKNRTHSPPAIAAFVIPNLSHRPPPATAIIPRRCPQPPPLFPSAGAGLRCLQPPLAATSCCCLHPLPPNHHHQPPPPATAYIHCRRLWWAE